MKSESEVAQSRLTPGDPMDRSLPGSSVHGTFQARVLEWAAIAFSITDTNTMLNYKSGFQVAQGVKNPPASVGERFDPWVGKIPWRWKWQPSSVFLPKKKILWKEEPAWWASLWGHKALDTTEHARNYKLMTRNNSRQDTMF